jgi:hypothetical protein
MSLSRRKFLRAGTLVAISAGIPMKDIVAETLNPPIPVPGGSRLNAALHLNRETFARYVNTNFSLSLGNTAAVTVKLAHVKDWTPDESRASAAATGRECFALTFVGAADEPLRQETYNVNHGSLGNFAMLVVPVGRDKKAAYYEAVFNRLF